MERDWMIESLQAFTASYTEEDWQEHEDAKIGNKHVEKPCVYKGVHYDNMTEAAKANGVSIGAVSTYVKREGKVQRYDMPIIYKGIRYNNISHAMKETGKCHSTIQSYVWRHNGV